MTTIELIEKALKEDMPRGDLTTEALGLNTQEGRAKLIAKEDLVLSGAEVFEQTVHALDPKLEVQWLFKNGDLVLKQQTLATIRGDMIALLKAERVALNFLGRLSGIATITRCFVEKTEGTHTKILDTRKTTPLLRELEKMAVKHGRGVNHRMNLSDAILVKENHIHVAGSIRKAIGKIRETMQLPIEVECRTLEDVREAVELRVQRILLDNMDLVLMKKCLDVIPTSIETEASGNMTLDRIHDVAKLGVTFISVGALTHSAPCADISLMFEWST